jgi:hypothetical protein
MAVAMVGRRASNVSTWCERGSGDADIEVDVDGDRR